MPVSTISALPAAPSRIGDAANFASESLAFLNAQSTFATDCNAVATYFNAAKFNPFDWGDLTPAGTVTPVNITNFIDLAPTNPPSFGYALADGIDNLLASMVAFVPDANAVATYIDGRVDPLAPVVVDPNRPTIPSVTDSPLRSDGASVFESKALSFYGTARAFGEGLQALAEYATEYLGEAEDWGSIATVYTETDDWGSIT